MPTRQIRPEATHHTSGGARLVAADGRELVLRGAQLRVDAGGGIARTVLDQHFANPYDRPLAITYQLPLPADGAVVGFAFQIGDRRVEGVVDRREAARQRYEEALMEGRTAAIVDQERSSLFTQEIGNVPPHTDVAVEITIDQTLRWLVGEGSWEWRFPTVVAPRYLGAEGRVIDAEHVTVDVTTAAPPATIGLAVTVRDALVEGATPHSPSHAIRSSVTERGAEVTLAAESGAALDRDLVVRWAVAKAAIATRIEVARPAPGDVAARSAYGLVTLLPPAAAERQRPRDLVVLLDASGSMRGLPLEQAKAVTASLVRSLDDADSLELIAFANEPRRFSAHPEAATAELLRTALDWIDKLSAGGGTEMDRAVKAALAPLPDGGERHVVLVTDGLIGFEEEIVADVLRSLPRRSRLHTIGVGPAVNRSLTASAARAGRGVEVLIGLDENGADASRRLLAQLDVPIAADIEVFGSALRSHAPARLRDLALGAPLLIAVELDPAGGELRIRGEGFETRFDVAAVEPATGNAALAKLFARERVEDLEMRAATGDRVDHEIERVGLEFSIATRLTSWVAVSSEATVDPGAPIRQVRIPHVIPSGLSVRFDTLADVLYRGGRTLALNRENVLGALNMRFGMERPSGEARTFGDLRREGRSGYGGHGAPRARVIVGTGMEIVLELDLGGLDWEPAELAHLVVREAKQLHEVVCSLDAKRSTAKGPIRRGEIARLVLIPARAITGSIVSLRLEIAGREIEIGIWK